jgi:hypothetical protein
VKTIQLPFHFGVLKIKHRDQLNFDERRERLPMVALGHKRLIWWSNANLDDDRRGVEVRSPAPVGFLSRFRLKKRRRHSAGQVVMAYSMHIPLWFGLLKIKSTSALRRDEREGRVPVWRVGNICFVWRRFERQVSKSPS